MYPLYHTRFSLLCWFTEWISKVGCLSKKKPVHTKNNNTRLVHDCIHTHVTIDQNIHVDTINYYAYMYTLLQTSKWEKNISRPTVTQSCDYTYYNISYYTCTCKYLTVYLW